jgi:SAM-dependent methyltransferase
MLRRAVAAMRTFLHPVPVLVRQDEVQRAQLEAHQRQLESLQHNVGLALGRQLEFMSRQIEFQREIRLLLGQASLPANALWQGKPNLPPALPEGVIFDKSVVCRQEDMDTPYFTYWADKTGYLSRYHRKLWEFVFICQTLSERGLLREGMRGLGFGVGAEPLPACFASRGCRITGTDMTPEAAVAAGWTGSQQHAAGKENLRRPAICDEATFEANVEFRICDMNDIPQDLTGYDFCWSACALEHLGSIEHGLAFIERSLDCLKPGGFAIHTTEFNLSSNADTVSEGGTVLFRRQDMEALFQRVKAKGHVMAPLDLDPGYGELDRYIDVPPYRDEPHLKLALWGYSATSIGIIIQKAQ